MPVIDWETAWRSAWEVIEDPLTVTLLSKRDEGDYLSHVVQYVLFREVQTTDRVQGTFLADASECTFHFWRDPLDASDPGLTPKAGDKVVVGSGSHAGTYTCRERKISNRGWRYRCSCRKDLA